MQNTSPTQSSKKNKLNPVKSWVDGKPVDQISLFDRGLAYGHGLFETICVVNGEPQLWTLHVKRLLLGCSKLFIPINKDLLQSQITAFLASLSGVECGVLKIIVSAGVGGRGYGLPAKVAPTIALMWFEKPVYPPDIVKHGAKLMLCETKLSHQPMLAGIKHLNRLEQVLARQELASVVEEIDEGLMLDEQASVIEGIMSNIFLVKNNLLITPDLTRAGVAGVMRDFIVENVRNKIADKTRLGSDCGDFLIDKVLIQPVTIEDLKEADEVFISNSLIGVWPVVELISHELPCHELQHHELQHHELQCHELQRHELQRHELQRHGQADQGQSMAWQCGKVTGKIQEIVCLYSFAHD